MDIGRSICGKLSGSFKNIAKSFCKLTLASMVIAETIVEDRPATGIRCWVEGRRVWLELDDQRIISFPAARYPLLADAPQDLLERVVLRVQGRALRWEELDEDIWVDDAAHGRFPKPLASAA